MADEELTHLRFGGPIDQVTLTLRFAGEELDPDFITERLGVLPTHANRRGQVVTGKRSGNMRVLTLGSWQWVGELPGAEPLEAHLSALFGRLSPDLDVWRELTHHFQADLFAGLFLETINRGFVLSPSVLSAIAARNLPLVFDIYGP